ncbi:hypothetical protein GPK34_08745 [Secundilactobacillus kimchicus]|nr:hypothetical protein [Secundilactobacillus kimchicus]MBT9672116.1 hypothetical protein [Secundilactobacillus kimchicus]
MENTTWLIDVLKELQSQQPKFVDQALLADTAVVVTALDQRLTELNGELDGRTWNPANW